MSGKKRRILVVMCMLVTLGAMATLTRCGSGIGEVNNASVSRTKF